MQRDLDRLEDILAETNNIASFIEGLDYELFGAERGQRYSILHALTIIGEASSRLSPELRARHDAIPWRKIIDYRHRVVHGYGSLNLQQSWQIAAEFAPELRGTDSVSPGYRVSR